MSKNGKRPTDPLETPAAGPFDALICGQFINPHGQPKPLKRGAYLGVQRPTARGQRYLESPARGGVAKASKA